VILGIFVKLFVSAIVLETFDRQKDQPSDHSSLSPNSRSEIASMPQANAPKLKAMTTITNSFIAIPFFAEVMRVGDSRPTFLCES
jgi:hypothetical protein